MIEPNQGMMFYFGNNEGISFECSAECCSEGWIEHIEGSENLLDATVLSVEEVPEQEIPDGDPRKLSTHDVLLIYFLKIKTTKGYVDIDYRNDSNGYYGTHLNWKSCKKHISSPDGNYSI